MFLAGPTSPADLFSWSHVGYSVPWKKCLPIVEQLYRLNKRESPISRGTGGQVAPLVGETPEMQMSWRSVCSAGGTGGVVGGSPLLFLAPMPLLWVDPCWKWSPVASAGASSTPIGISRCEKLWQPGSVGGRWRDCASPWVENEAKCDKRGNKIVNSFLKGGREEGETGPTQKHTEREGVEKTVTRR